MSHPKAHKHITGRFSSIVVDIPMVCEDNPNLDVGHDDCDSPGMYCEVCMIRKIALLREENEKLRREAE